MCAFIRTLVVMPNSHFPDAAEVGVCGDVEDVESIACEGSFGVKVTVPTAALTSIQTDSNMGCGAFTLQIKKSSIYLFCIKRVFRFNVRICC